MNLTAVLPSILFFSFSSLTVSSVPVNAAVGLLGLVDLFRSAAVAWLFLEALGVLALLFGTVVATALARPLVVGTAVAATLEAVAVIVFGAASLEHSTFVASPNVYSFPNFSSSVEPAIGVWAGRSTDAPAIAEIGAASANAKDNALKMNLFILWFPMQNIVRFSSRPSLHSWSILWEFTFASSRRRGDPANCAFTGTA